MQPRRVARSAMGVALLPPPGWDDVTNPTTYTRQGSNNKPDFDFSNLGLLFPQNDTGEKIYITGQMPHKWEGSTGRRVTIDPHLHYVQTGAALPVFALEYRFYANGGTIPGWTTISTSAGAGIIFPYTSGSILNILRWPDVILSGLGPSAWYDMIIYRTDNTVSGDVLVKAFDWHARSNDLGSRSIYQK
jgi:hypothetical protein